MNASTNWVGYVTIVRKEITRILRIWGQTIVPPAITMSLYFIIFGELIGRFHRAQVSRQGQAPHQSDEHETYGVFDLSFDWTDGRWQLVGCLD